ncbi:hypothetical protein CI610_01163 [invertebrate metagenome]|uniref:Uncharacterized protein n=1 Tax=invertebrate metagenome TaxID=1711999 RepID=A0A2H9T9E6_9ZZZZ
MIKDDVMSDPVMENPSPLSVPLTQPFNQGMPPLDVSDKPVSFFEFWPSYVIYMPVVCQWLMLAVRYRSLGMPLIANPGIALSGMVGESKSAIFAIAQGEAKQKIAPWMTVKAEKKCTSLQEIQKQQETEVNLSYPLVAKPDMGCRGAGVRIVRNDRELVEYCRYFPESSTFLLQKLIPYDAEAGIFYVRYPHQKKGKIVSITLKYTPYVTGNGADTLEQLIEANPRYGKVASLYKARHQDRLHKVVPEGIHVKLAFAGSHSRGSVFRDGCHYITPALEEAFDRIGEGLPGFFYGRIDIRFKDIHRLMQGEDFSILEINGASSEAAHIWDSRGSLRDLYRTLFAQYRTLFRLGRMNYQQGHRVPSILKLWKAWKQERRLVKKYPQTE